MPTKQIYAKEKNLNSKTWCKFHKSHYHNTKDCLKYKKYSADNHKAKHANIIDDNNKGFVIQEEYQNKMKEIQLKGKINGQVISCLFDTGSNFNLISRDVVLKLNVDIHKLENTKILQMANGQKENIDEQIEVDLKFVQIPHKTFKISCFVMKSLPVELNLGYSFMNKYGVVLNVKEETLTIQEDVIEYTDPSIIDKTSLQINNYIYDKSMITKEDINLDRMIEETKK
ncbi:hypothetical protein H311_03795, partial [Anncaliia algerae PRA109]